MHQDEISKRSLNRQLNISRAGSTLVNEVLELSLLSQSES